MTAINFSFSPDVSLQQMLAFNMAGQIWSSYLNDDITVDIQVTATSALPDNVLGGALPSYVEVDVAQVRDALAADATSNDDNIVLANLELEHGFSAVLEDEAYIGQRITLTRAQAEALGIPVEASSEPGDGQILINTLGRNQKLSWNEDLKRNYAIADDKIDLLSVALHEVGHILGFISGVDSTIQEGVSQQLAQTTLLDLFRYSHYSLKQNSRELTRGAAAYFSLDGGKTSLANFSTGIVPLGDYIDGYQASHWGPGTAAAESLQLSGAQLEGSASESLQAFVQILLDLSFAAIDGDWVTSPDALLVPPSDPVRSTSGESLSSLQKQGERNSGSSSELPPMLAAHHNLEKQTLGVMDPSLAEGERSKISDLDLKAFDVIGYDVTSASTMPNYEQLLGQAEASLAAMLDLDVEELRETLDNPALQDDVRSKNYLSSSDYGALGVSLRDSRWKILNNVLDSTDESGLFDHRRPRPRPHPHRRSRELYERRRSRPDHRSHSDYASFWQEEEVDASSVQIISNGGERNTEISLDQGSLNVTQVQAIPSAPLILRTQTLRGGNANDLLLPVNDKAQTLKTGNGNNVAVLGKAGGEIEGGWGNDTMMIQGGKGRIQDRGGNNFIWTQGAEGDSQSIQTGDGNDRIYFTPLVEAGRNRSSQSRSRQELSGFRFRGRSSRASSKYEVNAGSGDNILSIQGHDRQTIRIITGNGNDLIQAQGQSARITTGRGKDTVILGDAKGAYFRGSGYANITDFSRFDQLQLFGQASDYRIRRNRLLYRGDVIAKFGNVRRVSLSRSQVTFVGLGRLPDESTTVPSISAALKSVVEGYTVAPEITYSIMGGEDANQFQINPTTGELKFKAIATADSDANQDDRFEVTVGATQTLGNSSETLDTQNLSITFRDHTRQSGSEIVSDSSAEIESVRAAPWFEDTLGVERSDQMWIDKNGARLVEGQGALPNSGERTSNFMRPSSLEANTSLDGIVLGLQIDPPPFA